MWSIILLIILYYFLHERVSGTQLANHQPVFVLMILSLATIYFPRRVYILLHSAIDSHHKSFVAPPKELLLSMLIFRRQRNVLCVRELFVSTNLPSNHHE